MIFVEFGNVVINLDHVTSIEINPAIGKIKIYLTETTDEGKSEYVHFEGDQAARFLALLRGGIAERIGNSAPGYLYVDLNHAETHANA